MEHLVGVVQHGANLRLDAFGNLKLVDCRRGRLLNLVDVPAALWLLGGELADHLNHDERLHLKLALKLQHAG